MEAFADQFAAPRPQPIHLLRAGLPFIQDASLGGKCAVLHLPGRKHQMRVIVALVPLFAGAMQRHHDRHAPAFCDHLRVSLRQLPAHFLRESARQGHDDFAADRRVLARLRLVHQPRQIAGLSGKVHAADLEHAPAAAVIVDLALPRIAEPGGRDVRNRGRCAVTTAAGVRREVEMEQGLHALW